MNTTVLQCSLSKTDRRFRGASIRIFEHTGYQLLLLDGIKQSVPKTAAIFWPIVRPHLSSNTPDSSTSTLWQHQRHLAVTQGGGKKCPWISLAKHIKHSFTCHKILQHGASSFTSQSKEGVLRNFIAIKNPSPGPGLNPRPLGPVETHQPLHHQGDLFEFNSE
jgi:hypothetical protein